MENKAKEVKSDIIITCLPGLKESLMHELMNFGYQARIDGFSNVRLQGDLQDAIKLNLILRTASKVLLLLRSLPAVDLQSLYEGIKEIPWEEYFSVSKYFSVVSVTDNPAIKNTMFLNQKVKDAIADRFKMKFNQRPDSGPDKSFVVINVHWKNEVAEIYLDTSGNTIAKHGYRIHPFRAPLIESLAAAIVLSTGWEPSKPLILPMCGSGTLAIEAALIATHEPPNLNRPNFAFMHLIGYDDEGFEKIRSEIKSKIRIVDNLRIEATDRDPEAIEAARSNAQNAGVEHLIEFDVADFRQLSNPEPGSVIILNPPYGERMETDERINEFYKGIGNFFKQKCPDTTAFIFTANLEAAKHIGLRTSSRQIFYNGPLEARLLEYRMYSGSAKSEIK